MEADQIATFNIAKRTTTLIKREIERELHLLDGTLAPVGGEDDNGCERRLEGAVEVGEALNVQHVNLVYEEYTRHQLSNALVDVLVYHFVDLLAKFVWIITLTYLIHDDNKFTKSREQKLNNLNDKSYEFARLLDIFSTGAYPETAGHQSIWCSICREIIGQ